MCRWLVLLFASGTLWAQGGIVPTQVYSEPPGGAFNVDGRTYTGPTTFYWPEGSTHLLSLPESRPPEPNVIREFKEWQNSANQTLLDGPNIAITASAGITYYKAVWNVFYGISLELGGATGSFSCAAGAQSGKIYINLPAADSCYAASQVIWGQSGAGVQVQVYAPAGFTFLGWEGSFQGSTAPALAFILDRPIFLTARFGAAVRVTLDTSPSRMTVFADGQPVLTPQSFDWGEGSRHAIGIVAAQRDSTGGLWVFDSWSDGGAEYHDYVVGVNSPPVTLTARLVPGVTVGVISNPLGLPLTVDGRTSSQDSFAWGLGTRHTITAPAEQVDSAGRHWVFRYWSIGAEATQQVTVALDTTGWIATYEPMNSLTVRTDPAAVSFTVDGVACQGSCTVYRLPGTEVVVTAPASITLGDGTRVDFRSWSDGVSSPSRTVKLDADQRTLTAVYPYFQRFSASSDPAGSADFTFDPASADGYYEVGTSVTVTVHPHAGFRFRFWEGDLSGGSSSGTVKIGGPVSVRAVLDRVPFVAPTGVINAAGETPELGLAPGSAIAIYGANLAPDQVVGPSSPLAQTLANVTVRLTDRILPLYFVSPGQINALLPSGIGLGDYTLTVHWEGHDDARAGFRAVRNAPGLFTQPAGNVAYAIAIHEDGAQVTPEKPARPGETIALFGTGFGPYVGTFPEGFAIPDTLDLVLADPVKILTGDLSLDPASASAAHGMIGVVSIRFRVPDQAPAQMEVVVTANGVRSNAVVIPVGLRQENVNVPETR